VTAGDNIDVDLAGCIDLHIHTAPDVRPRLLDDLEATRQAAARGMKAMLLKSHVTSTADRASIAGLTVPGVRVFGGLALNHAVGGINSYAVEAALRMGAAQIWMPTISARAQRHDPVRPGLEIMANGTITNPVREVLELVAEHDAILGTGHLSVEETAVLVPAAREVGVRKILITHPEHPPVEMPVDVQRELRARYEVMFERCFISTPLAGGDLPYVRLAAIIRQVGVESTIISTDLGQPGNPAPVDGFAAYIAQLRNEGYSKGEICRMASENPAALLGID
jgi:Family of unknown function (DUF6282)